MNTAKPIKDAAIFYAFFSVSFLSHLQRLICIVKELRVFKLVAQRLLPLMFSLLSYENQGNWKRFMNKKIKAKRLLYCTDREALKIKENQAKLSRFKAYPEGNFVSVLSFEIFRRMAWTQIGR
jgi:hypothetical protein